MQYHVYILKCKDGTYYVGSTLDLEKRIYAHNNLKSGAHYTKIRRPVELVFSMKVDSFAEMRAKEAELKRMTKNEKAIFIALNNG